MARAERKASRAAKAASGKAKAAGAPRRAGQSERPEDMADDALLELVQRRTFGFFWDAAHPVSGLARDRVTGRDPSPDDELVGIGGSGFGVMAIIVAVERGWINRDQAVERLLAMLRLLVPARNYHGMLPHFMNGRTGATIPFSRKDDGGDIVETSYLLMGLLTAREYFDRDSVEERRMREEIGYLWGEAEWDWYTRERKLLYWHWSPNNGWALDHEIHGWNECLITYVMAASAPRYPASPETYHRGWAMGRDFLNGKRYYDIELPLGMPYGGPLFFTHYSFLGLDPHGLKDRYVDMWQQNTAHVAINRAHCIANPHGHKGYGEACWGLTASDDPRGYDAHAPDNDNGTISPTAALASFPYAPRECMQVLRHFFAAYGDRIWKRYGFVDAFNPSLDWFADTFLAIDQGPIILMIENYRTGLLWKLFMRVPEIQAGLRRLGFHSPYLAPPTA
jgi:hypothetical protein